MEKEFVDFETALSLKELGFNKPCLKGFYKGEKIDTSMSEGYDYNSRKPIEHFVSRPLFSQVFRWFREKYKLSCSIELTDNSRNYYYDFTIFDSKNRDYNDEDCFDSCKRIYDDGKYGTYEEAEQACIEKLIEIVKNK